MKNFFINLDNQIQRRKFFLKLNNYNNEINSPLFSRFPAIKNSDSRIKKIKGKLASKGKAVYLSHYELIKKNLNNDQDIWICEDDTHIFSETSSFIKNFDLEKYKWDIIFTDIGIGDIGQMIYLFQLKRKVKENDFILIELAKFKFFGLSSYIVNRNSKKKILTFLDEYISKGINQNLDLIVRNLSKSQVIKTLCFFPFITSVNKYADIDGVNSNATSKTFNIFRKLMCFKKEYLDKKDLEFIEQTFKKDDQSYFMSKVLQVFLHPDFNGE